GHAHVLQRAELDDGGFGGRGRRGFLGGLLCGFLRGGYWLVIRIVCHSSLSPSPLTALTGRAAIPNTFSMSRRFFPRSVRESLSTFVATMCGGPAASVNHWCACTSASSPGWRESTSRNVPQLV